MPNGAKQGMDHTRKYFLATVALLLIVVVGLVATAGLWVPSQNNVGTNPTPTQGPYATVPPGATQRTYVLYDQGQNSLDATASLTEGTNYDVTYYVMRGGVMTYVAAAASTTATFTLYDTDGSYIYAAVVPHSGQHYYVDSAKTDGNSPAIVGASYQILANTNQWVFTIDRSAMTLNTDTNKYEFYGTYWFMTYTAPTLGSPADITSVGTSPGTVKYLNWATTTTEKTAFALTKVTFEANTTDLTKVQLNYINIPGFQNVTPTDPTEGATTLKWTWTVSPYDLSAAKMISLPTGGNNNFDFQTKLTVDLASGDVITCTLSLYGLDETGNAVAAITDTANLSA